MVDGPAVAQRRPGSRSVRTLSFMGLVVGLSLPVLGHAQTMEYEVKAVMQGRLTEFVDWPSESMIADTSNPFVIGVVGENPFGSLLEDLYADTRIKGKRVSIRYVADTSEMSPCHLLFIATTDDQTLANILSFTGERAILTVADTEGFAEQGVLVNLTIIENRIGFQINESAVRSSGLEMSHLLLRLAQIVEPSGGRK